VEKLATSLLGSTDPAEGIVYPEAGVQETPFGIRDVIVSRIQENPYRMGRPFY